MTSPSKQMGAIQRLDVPHTRAHLPRHFEILAVASFLPDEITIMYKSSSPRLLGFRQVVLKPNELGSWEIADNNACYLGEAPRENRANDPQKWGQDGHGNWGKYPRRNVAFHLKAGHHDPAPNFDRKTYRLAGG